MNTPSAPTNAGTARHETTSRELSPGERWYWIIDQLSTLNVCARVRIQGEISAPALRTALRALQDRHPLLRVAIAAGDPQQPGTGPRFVPTARPVPLREVLLAAPEEDRWAGEIDARELTDPIDRESGPLARAVLISTPGQTHDLVLTVPHCIADGTTALSLLRQWVHLAAQPPAGAGTTGGGLPEPFEALFPPRPGPRPEAGAQDPQESGETGRLRPERFVPFDQRRTRMLHRSLDGDVLERLAAACKREGTTLHGVLAAALACAVAHDAQAAPQARFAVGSPLSLRDELRREVTEDEAGCYVSALHSVVRYQPEDLWAMARFVNDDIAARKKHGEQYEVFDLLAVQGPAGTADSGPFIRHFEENGPFNFFVSNIGRFAFPTELGAWHLSGAQFVGGISVVGYLGSSVTTSQGRLSWNFTYIEEAVSRQRAERIADDSIRRVTAAAGNR
ncbi:condensation domain-containing protein [Streptomyces sp. NPDC004284]|uniref:condensation domain-containing protein n=1 Tax=Streptomyces sp. NPDC004284 TaxID=3364695 RepID=UPI003681C91A